MIIGIDASRAAIAKRTGTEGYAHQLIRALIPLANERGHHVKLYFNKLPTQPLSDAPHETVHIPFPRLWTHVRLAAHLLWEPPTVFFTPAHVIPFSYFRPSVATIHDLGYLFYPETHTKSQLRQLHWGTRHNAERSRYVIADSKFTRVDLIADYKISPLKIKVVYPGRDATIGRVSDAATLAGMRAKYGITSDYLLNIGTIQPRKNIGRLVQSFAQIADQIPHQLVLAGNKGWLSAPILDEIDALPAEIKQRIHITGFVADEDKAALISGATALLYPSLHEGFGFPVLEGQACEVPVLASQSSSLPEVANDSVLYVDPQDADSIAAGMIKIVQDQALREKLVACGKENIQRFDWSVSAEKTLDILEKAAE